MTRFRSLSAAAAVVLSIGAADAASITVVPNGDGASAIQLSGRITEGDGQSFERAVDASGGSVNGVVLSSPGGLLNEGARIAAKVKGNHMTVLVPDGVVCASSCFMIFAAGGSKIVGHGAKVGVHNASEVGGKISRDSEAMTLEMAQDAKRLGVPEVIIGKMVVTPANGISWLSDEDLRLMGATRLGAAGVLAYAAPRARITPADGWVPSYADSMGAVRTRRR